MSRQESRELVELMRTQFPKFSKVTLCMIRNKDYGVDYSSAAKKLLKKQKPKESKTPDRKRLTVRVDPDLYDELKELAGGESYQKLVERIISEGVKHATDS